MKKILLTLIGVVGTSAASLGQVSTNIGGWPMYQDSFELSGVYFTNNGTVHDFSGPGWYTDRGSYEVFFKRVNNDGTISTLYLMEGLPLVASVDSPDGSNLFIVYGDEVSGIPVVPPNSVVNPGWCTNETVGFNWVNQNIAPLPTPTPTPVPVPTPSSTPSVVGGGASGGVLMEQAVQLNKGLSFQSGQWSVQ
jgi:hypothetical protein